MRKQPSDFDGSTNLGAVFGLVKHREVLTVKDGGARGVLPARNQRGGLLVESVVPTVSPFEVTGCP